MARQAVSTWSYLPVIVSSDDMSAEERKQHTGADYAAGMLGSTFCWIPRGDNPTSRRVFDAVAAGQGLMDSARHVIACHLTRRKGVQDAFDACHVTGCQLNQQTRARNAFDDVVSNIHQSLPPGASPW